MAMRLTGRMRTRWPTLFIQTTVFANATQESVRGLKAVFLERLKKYDETPKNEIVELQALE